MHSELQLGVSRPHLSPEGPLRNPFTNPLWKPFNFGQNMHSELQSVVSRPPSPHRARYETCYKTRYETR